MMATGGSFPFYDSVELDCRIIGLPYRKRLTTMYIILPNNSTRYRLRQFQAALTADKIEDMISKMEWKTAIVLFPKMHLTNRVDLKKILNRMGLRSLFNYDQSDLSLISTGVETVPYLQSNFVERPFVFNRFAEIDNNNRTDVGRNMANETAPAQQNETKRGRRSVVMHNFISYNYISILYPCKFIKIIHYFHSFLL